MNASEKIVLFAAIALCLFILGVALGDSYGYQRGYEKGFDKALPLTYATMYKK